MIAAEGERQASRALTEAADMMARHPAALHLRYLQELKAVSAEKSSALVFPLPLEILARMAQGVRPRDGNMGKETASTNNGSNQQPLWRTKRKEMSTKLPRVDDSRPHWH